MENHNRYRTPGIGPAGIGPAAIVVACMVGYVVVTLLLKIRG